MKTIFVAKTERLLCSALCSCCASLGLDVIGSSTDGKESFQSILDTKPDFAIVEMGLPSMNGLDVVRKLERAGSPTRLILYIKNQNPIELRRALSVNVDSLLFSEDGINELAYCFREKTGPSSIFGSAPYQRLNGGEPKNGSLDLLSSLTPTQLKILALVSTHKTMPEIAGELFISPHTVNNHVANIRKKLDLQGRGSILKYALANKHRLVEVDGKIRVAKNTYCY